MQAPSNTAELVEGSAGDPAALALRGSLTAETVPALWGESARLFGATRDRVTIDLGGVTEADSAGLALLVTWAAQALSAKTALGFTGVPERLLSLARISEVEELLRPA